jgi:2-(1,2-epoxy-1,2-dihydrophenyl)acetyl-CoA isomerase
MAYETILVEIEEQIATITLNRPEKLNALSPQMRQELREAIDDAGADDEIRVVIITGAGRGFCAGLDITPSPDEEQRPLYTVEELRHALMHPQSRERWLPKHREPTEAIRGLGKPTICALNGVMAGAGSGIALACDVIIASDQASFLVATTRIGLILEFDTSWALPRRIGTHRALELAYTNDRIDAREMERINLVNKVVPHDELMKSAGEMARKMFQIMPLSLALVKQCVYRGLDHSRDIEAQAIFDLACETALFATPEDKKEAANSFWEKRAPEYKGK